MQHDEFIGQVQARARLSSRGEAETVTRAVLEALAARLAGGQPENLGGQLPPEIARHLEVDGEAEKLSLEEFFDHVGRECGSARPDAVHHSRVVLEVLAEAVGEGETGKVRQQLPEEFAPLFTSGSEGRMES